MSVAVANSEAGMAVGELKMEKASAFDILMTPVRAYKTFARAIATRMPKGLFARALIIIIAPIVLLEGVVAFTDPLLATPEVRQYVVVPPAAVAVLRPAVEVHAPTARFIRPAQSLFDSDTVH